MIVRLRIKTRCNDTYGPTTVSRLACLVNCRLNLTLPDKRPIALASNLRRFQEVKMGKNPKGSSSTGLLLLDA